MPPNKGMELTGKSNTPFAKRRAKGAPLLPAAHPRRYTVKTKYLFCDKYTDSTILEWLSSFFHSNEVENQPGGTEASACRHFSLQKRQMENRQFTAFVWDYFTSSAAFGRRARYSAALAALLHDW